VSNGKAARAFTVCKVQGHGRTHETIHNPLDPALPRILGLNRHNADRHPNRGPGGHAEVNRRVIEDVKNVRRSLSHRLLQTSKVRVLLPWVIGPIRRYHGDAAGLNLFPKGPFAREADYSNREARGIQSAGDLDYIPFAATQAKGSAYQNH
jgi:hypothetical protein